MQEGSNNVFYGNTMIAQKGVQIGKGGDLMKLFVNWVQLSPTIDPLDGTITDLRNCSYQQIGDQVKVSIDMTVQFAANSGFCVVNVPKAPLLANNLIQETNNAIMSIDSPAVVDGLITVFESDSSIYIRMSAVGTVVNIGESMRIIGEVAYTTTK